MGKISVVTGASGMIGSALTEKLLSLGNRVFAVVRPDSDRNSSIPAGAVRVGCDIEDYSRLSGLIGTKCDEFYHLAWKGTFGGSRNDMEMQTGNILASVKAAKAASELGCSVFVFAGSQAEYGRVSGDLTADTPVFPENGYGMAKLCAGSMTRSFCADNGIRHIRCRILSVYGPYDGKNTMISSAAVRFLRGEKPQFTAGEQQWDYLFRDDAAEALRLCAQNGRDGAVYCIGSGKARPLKEYILALRDCIDTSLPVGIGEIPYPKNQVMYLCADISDLTRDTGFVPCVSFEDGIKRTVEWIKSQIHDGDRKMTKLL